MNQVGCNHIPMAYHQHFPFLNADFAVLNSKFSLVAYDFISILFSGFQNHQQALSSEKLPLKLFIEKDKKKVVFADADTQLVTYLRAMFELPIGNFVENTKGGLGILY